MKKGPNLLTAPTCVGLDQPSDANLQTNFIITKFSIATFKIFFMGNLGYLTFY